MTSPSSHTGLGMCVYHLFIIIIIIIIKLPSHVGYMFRPVLRKPSSDMSTQKHIEEKQRVGFIKFDIIDHYHSFNEFKNLRRQILIRNLNIFYVLMYVLVLTCLSVVSVQAEMCSISRRKIGIDLINFFLYYTEQIWFV